MIENSEKPKLYDEFIDVYKKNRLHYKQAQKLFVLIKKFNLSLYEKAFQEYLDAQKAYIEMIIIFEEMILISKDNSYNLYR